ncbi:MAG: 1-deoxy-D-xylulose-5-phosphate synthase [Paludibacteraceae bacterium]|nr:1-deoxy-D-xylulose-5-phosphate synthase [Paludibacteraceae bacterium]
MEYKYLNTIDSPDDLKKLPVEALPDVCQELRDFIISELSHNPGHLASSLGTVELTVALHYTLDTPNDKLVWDVGHQAYAHKILTGRRDRFCTNRKFGGLAPFPTPMESEYDSFVAGHASNSISAALGMEIAHKVEEDTESKVVAVIGDGAMTGGLAFEGLNNTSMNKNDLLIVLNDNNMAIDPIKGGFTEYLVSLTTSSMYNRRRWQLYQWMLRHHLLREENIGKLRRLSNNLKALFSRQGTNIFQGLNLKYFGPTDGHDVIELVRILNEIKNHRGPKVLHIITTKGKGYAPAENNQTVWHAPGEFNPENGERKKSNTNNLPPLWQDVFGETLLELAKNNKKIVGVTPAMPSGCSMTIMQKELPERVFDVGIAEGHAVTFSAGMAKEGIIPYCNIYSSFMQRAYDNIIHDVALQNLHVVLCIDRAGIVGNDGATHHGLFDMAYLRPIPNMQICSPMKADDLRQMLRLAETMEGPVAIRYPRGRSVETDRQSSGTCQIGKGVALCEGNDLAVLSIGAIGNTVEEAIQLCKEKQPDCSIAHWDMRWLKPIDEDILAHVGRHYRRIVTVEDGITIGGLGSAVTEYMTEHGHTAKVTRLGINNQFVEHGSTNELYHLLHLDKEGICASLLSALEQ